MIPISQLDDWTHGLDEQTTARAILALGLRRGSLVSSTRPGPVPPVRAWTLHQRGLGRKLETPAAKLAADVDETACRVAVGGDVIAIEVARRLRHAPSVLSAFATVRREQGSLRHRPWSWPLRIALHGFDPADAASLFEAVRIASHVPDALLDLRRIEDEPAAVDLLVTRFPVEQATLSLVEAKPLANAVIVLGEPFGRWSVVDALLTTIRAATGAVATALVPSTSLDQALGAVVREMSHALPIDMAATIAWHGEALLWAEPNWLDRSLVPQVGIRRAREFRAAARVIAHALPPEAPMAAEALDGLAEGAFAGETGEASGMAAASATLDTALDSVPDERWLQARVNAEAAGKPQNAFGPGDNEVLVFVGPVEDDALHTKSAFDDRKLPWKEEDAEGFRLTVVLAPLVPRAEPQTEQIELPRFGRSQTARFRLSLPDGAPDVSARLLVIFRNRILQTAVLAGRVGETATLTELLVLVPALAGLDERRAFDAALLANHDTKGLRALINHSSPRTRVTDGGAIQATIERLSEALLPAADLKPSAKGLEAKRARDILVRLAVNGRELNDRLESLAEARRIQVVTASGDWFLPIELAYEREAPNDGARVCENFLRDPLACGPACPPSLDVVCPNAFWGLSRTIERHRFDPELEEDIGAQIVLVGQPRAKRRTLSLERAVLGTSAKVQPPDVASTLAALGAPANATTGWAEWEASLAQADTHLLVLLPHTNYADPSLEISTKKLVRGRIEQRHVTGGRQVEPVVVLFGCRTSGTRGDPGGFASRFMSKDAAIVFHSLTDLKAGHASQMAERLVTLLRSARDHSAVSELLTVFRRDAVHAGLLAALAISAYGDADWRL